MGVVAHRMLPSQRQQFVVGDQHGDIPSQYWVSPPRVPGMQLVRGDDVACVRGGFVPQYFIGVV